MEVPFENGTLHGNASNTSHGTFEDDGCSDVGEHLLLLRRLWMIGGYPILVVGTLGQILMLSVLLSSKVMRSLPTSVFLLVMSTASLVALYVGLLSSIVEHQTCHHVMFRSMTTEVGCRLHVATNYFSLQLLSWMEVCLALERFTAVRHPLSYGKWFSIKKNVMAVCAIVATLLALNVIPYLSYGYDEAGFCTVLDRDLFEHIWKHVHAVVYVAAPVVIMIPCNVITLRTMRQLAFKESVNAKVARPLTVTTLSLNAIFAITTFPIMVGSWDNLDESQYEVVEIVWCICRLFMYLGSSLTFAICLSLAASFRTALLSIILSGKRALLRAATSVGSYQSGFRPPRHSRPQGDHADGDGDGEAGSDESPDDKL